MYFRCQKTIYLTIQYKDYNENNISHELTLNFNFQPFYKVNYSSISVESSPNSIIGTDTLYAKIDSNIKYIDVLIYLYTSEKYIYTHIICIYLCMHIILIRLKVHLHILTPKVHIYK